MDKERIIGNWKTSIIGIPFLLFGCFMILSKIMFTVEIWATDPFNVYEIITTFTVGWAFLSAKDTLLGGMFGIITKLFIKK